MQSDVSHFFPVLLTPFTSVTGGGCVVFIITILFLFFLCLYQFWVCVAAVGERGKKNSRDLLV